MDLNRPTLDPTAELRQARLARSLLADSATTAEITEVRRHATRHHLPTPDELERNEQEKGMQ